MIEARCETESSIRLEGLEPFQGKLKRRTKRQLEELKASLRNEGLIAPFFAWRAVDGEAVFLLDGHARREALLSLAEEDPSILQAQEFPVVYIEAESYEKAKQSLLQITSQYGTIDKEGAKAFCESIKGYRAPAVKSVYRKPYVKRMAAPAAKERKPVEYNEDTEVALTIAVPRVYEKAVRDLFQKVSYIRVL